MKAKEYVIQKLVGLGKKHRWLKYPMLALVSLISFFFLILEKCMERPKRAVVMLVCTVLIISQGWYLISIASETENPDALNSGNEGGAVQADVVPQNEDAGEAADQADGNDGIIYTVNLEVTNGLGTKGRLNLEKSEFATTVLSDKFSFTDDNGEYWNFDGWYTTDDPQTAQKIDTLSEDLFTNYTLTLYAQCSRKAFKVTFNAGEGEFAAGAATHQKVDVVNGVATATINNPGITRAGFSFVDWEVKGRGAYIPVGGTYDVATFNDDIEVTPKWIPNRYTINFKADSDTPEGAAATGSMESRTVDYDETVVLDNPQTLENGFRKPGYIFTGWLLQGTSQIYYADAVSGLTTVNNGNVTLVAQWAYQNASFTPATIQGSYGDIMDEEIAISHTESDKGIFTTNVTSVSGSTIDGTSVTSVDEFTDLTGITIDAANQNEIHLTTAETGVQTVGNFIVNFSVTDVENNKTIPLALTINLTQKELRIDDIQYKSRPYNGTTDIGIGAIQVSGIVNNDDVVAYNDGRGVFEDENAGEGKKITIYDIRLLGSKAKYYTAPASWSTNEGTITKAQALVTTFVEYPENQDYILTGQVPSYNVSVDLSQVEGLSDEIIARDAAEIAAAVAGHYTCDYITNGYLPGTYPVGIDTESVTLQNYYLQVIEGTLVVKQDKPVEGEGKDYTIIGNVSPDGWYYGPNEPRVETISTSNYNTVYVMDDPAKRAKTYEPGLFSHSVTITAEMARHDLYIQLGNEDNHAVTSVEPLKLKIDVTPPTIDTANITIDTVNNTGLQKIGHFLSFGNFFKEKLVVTVPVVDLRADGSTPDAGEVSGAESLTYYLDSDILTSAGTTIEVKDGKAVFELPLGFKGQIAFIAKDKAGNVTERASLIGIENSNYWVIENTAPEIVLTATDEDGKTAYTGNENYYREVTVTATATDADAGIAYILWTVTKNGEVIAENEQELVSDNTRVMTQADFTKTFTESGAYKITAIAYDNADNVSLESVPMEFIIDSTQPEITVTPTQETCNATWAKERVITFTITDLESGFSHFILKARTTDNVVSNYPFSVVKDKENTYQFTAAEKGTYTIFAYDNAGNEQKAELELTKISSEVPENPVVTITPEIPEDVEKPELYWYSENPTITITEPATTPDGTAITTYYHIWKAGTQEPTYDNQRAIEAFQLPDEGIWNLRVWAESESGMRNAYEDEDDGLYQIRYDGTAPVISNITITGTGTNSRVRFQVMEDTCGLASLTATYNDDASQTKTLSFEQQDTGVYTASFTASMQGSYMIEATDWAGNTSKTDAFEPMGITVTEISGNAERGITVKGIVTAGTFDITGVAVSYGVPGADAYLDADSLITVTDDLGNKSFTAKFTQLAANTRYGFSIKALSASGEGCSYAGFFRTEGEVTDGINIAGTVKDEVASTTPTTVFLYDGDSVLQTYTVKSGETQFYFNNVPDGSYTIQAKNGNRMTSQGLVIKNHTVIEPTGSILLTIRAGQVTDVVLGEDVPNIVISNLDVLFGDSTNFGAEDEAIIQAGGIVEFLMKIQYVDEKDVPNSDLACLQRTMNKNEKVAMYLDFSILKRAYGAYGMISETPVTAIAGGKNVRMIIPLSEALMQEEGVCVIRVHDGKADRMVDLDSNVGTYTLDSSLYSTYALVYTDKKSGTDDTSTGSTGTTDTNGSTATTATNSNGSNNSSASTSDISTRQDSSNITIQTSSNTNGKNTSGGSQYSPKTGDEAPIGWIAVLFAGTAILGIVSLKNKKRQ